MRLISDIFKGHLFLFERPLQALPTKMSAVRFVLAFLLSGVVLLAIGREMIPVILPENPLASRLLITLALLISSLMVVRIIAGQHWSFMGLRPWRDWTRREKFYAIQVLPAASILFYFLFQGLFADKRRCRLCFWQSFVRPLMGLLPGVRLSRCSSTGADEIYGTGRWHPRSKPRFHFRPAAYVRL